MLGWYIPDVDPYVLYAIKEISRWIGDNQNFLCLWLALWGWAKVQAMKTRTVVDDKVISWILYISRLEWLRDIRAPKGDNEKC